MSAAAIDFDKVNEVARANLEGLLSRLFPAGRINGSEFEVGSLDGETGKSFKVNLRSKRGVWSDFAGDVKGSDPVSLYAAIHGIGQAEAARMLAGELGIDPDGIGAPPRAKASKAKPADDWRPILPVPDDTMEPEFTHRQHGKPVAVWTYRDGSGRLLGYVCRFDPGQGRKEVLPLTYCQGPDGSCCWRWKSFPEPRPLYGLDLLAAVKPDAPVLLVEGEKTVDAAQELAPWAVCMTWPGGCKAVAKADFKPLAGRRVAIWPDADEPGREAAHAVAVRVKDVGASEVSIISPPDGVAKGWDLADAEGDGWTTERVKGWIVEHKAPAPEPEPERASLPRTGFGGFMTPAEYMKPPAATRWLIRGYLEAASFAVLFGESGVMKSFMALDMALSIAANRDWHGNPITNPGSVFYIAGEGLYSLPARVKAWCIHHGVDPLAVPLFISGTATSFLEPDHAQAVADAMATLAEQHGPPRLVIVDTLARNMGGGDENSTQDMGAFITALDGLKVRFDCALIVVHHTGLAAKDRSRGSSALRAAADREYRMADDNGVKILTATKVKDHEPPRPLGFRHEAIFTGWTDPGDLSDITSLVLVPASLPEDFGRAKGRSMGKQARLAWAVLQELYGPNQQPVHMEEWREATLRSGLTDSPDHKTRFQAFRRAKDDLLEQGLIAFKGDYWIPTDLVFKQLQDSFMTPLEAQGFKASTASHPLKGEAMKPPLTLSLEAHKDKDITPAAWSSPAEIDLEDIA